MFFYRSWRGKWLNRWWHFIWAMQFPKHRLSVITHQFVEDFVKLRQTYVCLKNLDMVNTCTLVLRTRYLAVHLDYFLSMLICCSVFLFTKKIQQFYPLVYEQRLVGNLISSTISCQTKNKYLKRQVEEIDTVLQKANPKRILIGTNVDSDTKSTTGVRTIPHFEYDVFINGVQIYRNAEKPTLTPILGRVHSVNHSATVPPRRIENSQPCFLGYFHGTSKPNIKKFLKSLIFEL